MKKIMLMLFMSSVLVLSAFSAEPVTITFYHTSDLHEAPDGLIRIAKIVSDKKKEGGNVLFVDTGDWFNKGELSPLKLKGEAITEMIGAAKYDAVIPGNHDYTFGTKRLVELIDKYSLPVLAANCAWPNKLPPYRIFELKGVRVAIIGSTTHIMNKAIDKDLDVKPIAESVDAVIDELEGKADVIVLLTHIGVGRDKKIIKAVPRLDILFGGHDHIKKMTKLNFIKKTKTILQHSGMSGKLLGEVTITWDGKQIVDRKARLITITKEMPQSENVKAVVEKYLPKSN